MNDLPGTITDISLGAILVAILVWLGRLIKPHVVQIPGQIKGIQSELVDFRRSCETQLKEIEKRLIEIERLVTIVDLRMTFVDQTRQDHVNALTQALQKKIREEKDDL